MQPKEEQKSDNNESKQENKQEQSASKQEQSAVSQETQQVKEQSVVSKVQAQQFQQQEQQSDNVISRSQAKSAALAHAKVDADQAKGLKAELDRDNGNLYYEVEFYVGGSEFEYKIDAKSKEILSAEKDDVSILNVAKYISSEKAINVALNHAGIAKSEAREVSVELEDGKSSFFEVDFEYNGVEYEYRIDAQNGKILHHRNEID